MARIEDRQPPRRGLSKPSSEPEATEPEAAGRRRLTRDSEAAEPATPGRRGAGAAGGGALAGGRATRPHKRATKDRGAETRSRLIDAALDVFGHTGFDGATTRQIAKAADANLAAILYHFGSKEALYRAVAEHIVGVITTRTKDALAIADRMADGVTADVALTLLTRLVETVVDVLLGSAEAERWARFILREQLDPTPVFEVIYGFMGPAHGLATRLVAAATGTDPEDRATKLRTFSLLGQVLVFRVAQTLVLRRLGIAAIGPIERAEIKRILAENLRAILSKEGNHA